MYSDCDACIPACPPDAIYEDEDDCIELMKVMMKVLKRIMNFLGTNGQESHYKN